MQLHRLEGFYYVAVHGGYARAARAFPYPITQPGVHQQVRKLERELGVELFERTAKDRVRPTAAGKHLFRFCSPFFRQLPGVVSAMRAGSYGGRVAIDASGLVLTQLLPGWVRQLREKRPDISVDICEVQTPEFTRLDSGTADLIVDYVPSVPVGYQSQQVAVGSAYVIVPRDHPAAAGGRVRIARLKDMPLVCYHPELRQHDLQLRAVRTYIGEPVGTVSASSVQAICALVQAGLGYSIVPWLAPEGPTFDGLLAKRQRSVDARFAIRAVWRGARGNSPLVDAALCAIGAS